MAQQPIQLDINELLDDFARENAGVTQRAILAEANVKARDKVIDKLAERVAELQDALEAREALDATADEANPEPSPDGELIIRKPVKDAPQA